jgi:GNAT superfamily N-acetyltransferase
MNDKKLPVLNFREATIADIPQIQVVRNAVKENRLSNPDLVTNADCESFIIQRGKGWVCEMNEMIVGFAIVDLKEENVWALFLLPEFEKRGIGKRLHHLMLGWYFGQSKKYLWLSTAPRTRAENFYRKAGWIEAGIHGKGELKFEMTNVIWEKIAGC